MTTLGDVLRFTAEFTMPGGSVAEWVWYRKHNTGSSQDDQDVLDGQQSILSDAWDFIKDQVNSGVVGALLSMAILDAAEGVFNTTVTNVITDLVGTDDTGDMMPHEIAVVTKFFTTLAKRQGRKYLFGFQEEDHDASVWNSSVLASAVLFAGAFKLLETVGDANIPAGVWNAADGFKGFINEYAVLATVGSQRRRRPGIGI